MSQSTGLFITVEGIDGCGKSTQADLIAAYYQRAGREVVRGREPGGAALSEKIRAMLLDPSNQGMVPECELLLFEAGRAQNVREVIQPALARGAVVIFDRFHDSSTAYQRAARGLSPEVVQRANELGTCGVIPHVTLVFNLPAAEAAARRSGQADDRIEAEGLAFQQRVADGYQRLALQEPSRVRIINASGTPEEVFSRALAVLAEYDKTIPRGGDAS